MHGGTWLNSSSLGNGAKLIKNDAEVAEIAVLARDPVAVHGAHRGIGVWRADVALVGVRARAERPILPIAVDPEVPARRRSWREAGAPVSGE